MPSVNPFVKATAVSKKLKILFTGPAGSGKTQALMTFPGLSIIDTERSTDLYLDGRNDVEIFRTMDLPEIEKAIQWRREHPTEVFGLDSITPVYQVLLEAEMKRIDAKGATKESPYTKTNSRIRWLYNDLVSLDCHVVVTARETTNYKSQGGFFTADGVKSDTSKDIDFLFDFIVRFDDQHHGHVEKQRGNKIHLPDVLPVVNWEVFAPVAEAYANGEAIDMEDERKVLDRAAATSFAKPMPKLTDPDDMTAEVNAREFVGKWQKQGVSVQDLKTMLHVDYFTQWAGGVSKANGVVEEALRDLKNVKEVFDAPQS